MFAVRPVGEVRHTDRKHGPPDDASLPRRGGRAGRCERDEGSRHDKTRGSEEMSRSKWRLTSRLCQAAAAVLLTGAALAAPAHADGVLNGQTIRLIVIGDPVFKAMQQMHDDMEKKAGGKIELNVLPFDALHQQTLLNAQNKESRY